ncbi:MAG: hypothetical protein AAF542_08415 [Pseudomonadota bacterium]
MTFSVVTVGVALVLASSIVFHYRLYGLNAYLKEEHPELWKKYGFGNNRLNSYAKLQTLTSLSIEYTSDDSSLKRQLKNLTAIYWSSSLGIAIILIGVGISLMGSDA